MSNVNIKRVIENIHANNTNKYTPIVELIVNAIQAIDEAARSGSDGKVVARILRSNQRKLYGSLSDIRGFEIQDNGIGFTDNHRESFDTLYTDYRISEGGKGFGRFICLKYFDGLKVKSVYREGTKFNLRSFSMGQGHEIIVDEEIERNVQEDSGTSVTLIGFKNQGTFEKKLSTIAKNITERLLPYFITQDYECPEIVICENNSNGNDAIHLNDFLGNEVSGFIREVPINQNSFSLQASDDNEEEFLVRVFKIYAPGNHKSRISLVAHKREVSGSSLYNYIPEFEEEFYEEGSSGEVCPERNYIVKAYVFGTYLDRNVSLERGGFEFSMDNDLLHGISQTDIESRVAAIAQDAVGSNIKLRQEKKKERVQSYVTDEAPWYKNNLSEIDLSEMPHNPTNQEIETHLHKYKFNQELTAKNDVVKILSESNFKDVTSDVVKIVNKISGTSKDELIHYIALRKRILDIFERSLEVDETGEYSSEGVVHDIIFPRRGDTETTSFDNHNLWILDERLNFTNYVCSDIQLDKGNTGRPDLLVYNKRVLFRGDNEASNPVTIFEFKRPQHDDFANPSVGEDPVQQVVRYVNNIRNGKYKNPQGRDILVAENTPFYGFIVCDLSAKIKEWLKTEQDFKPMPDGLGWFQWRGNINLYIEVISWDKVLKDAQIRNKIFFQKLNIN